MSRFINGWGNGSKNKMKRFIITGTPGCGKTSLIQELEVRGYSVIHESATDVIAAEQASGNKEPWKQPDFIDKIIAMQKTRQIQNTNQSILQFYDRSPICTYALSVYLGFEPSVALMQEIERVQKERVYEPTVFFLDNLGFIKPTEARRISFEESLIFEKIHEEAYAQFGYTCVKIPPVSQQERVELILNRAFRGE
jgi:predicted ATPase